MQPNQPYTGSTPRHNKYQQSPTAQNAYNRNMVVPEEYDYLSGQAPRQLYQQKAPLKVEVDHQGNSVTTFNRRPLLKQLEKQQQQANPSQKISSASEFSSISDMYQALDATPSLSSSASKSATLSTAQGTTLDNALAVSVASSAKEEKKNPFWDSLDPDNWVQDSKVKSCFLSQHDFSFTRRRHHCRKCGNIFCHECIRKRTIAGVQAKICTQCEKLYDVYTKNLARVMQMTRNNQRELENQDKLQPAWAAGLSGPLGGEDGTMPGMEDALKIMGGQQQWGEQTGLTDYMNKYFQSSKDIGQLGAVQGGEPAGGLLRPLSGGASFQGGAEKSIDYMDRTFNENQRRFTNSKPLDLQDSQVTTQQQAPSLQPLDKSYSNSAAYQQDLLYLFEYSKRHIQKVVSEQLFLNDLRAEKWETMLTEFVMKAVEQVKPSSRMLGDIMDINEFIKVKIIDFKDNSKSQYINGIVMSKSIASKRMNTSLVNPRILLLKELGSDEAQNPNFVIPDLATKIDIEGHTDKILEQKLAEINPNLVIVQSDISVKLLNLMRDRDITVVSNLEQRKMKRLARLTQTIVLPSISVIGGTFQLGQCKLFREDNLSRQLREQNAYYGSTHNHEQTLLVFDGCNPVLGCTICLSGPLQTEGNELEKVKHALKQMLILAKNIVLERHFLTQIQCELTEPPRFEDDEQAEVNVASINPRQAIKDLSSLAVGPQKQMQRFLTNPTLEDTVSKWEMTDLYSPYLITNFVNNRNFLVYKKIKILLKQRDEPIPSGPTAYGMGDYPQDLANDTLGDFLRDTNADRSNTVTTVPEQQKPFFMADGKLNINERYIQTKLDKMCGMPKDNILYFCRQNIDDDTRRERNDQTLGKYLEQLAQTAKLKCNDCSTENFNHSQEIYHRDGQIQITIKPQAQQMVAENATATHSAIAESGFYMEEQSEDMSFHLASEIGQLLKPQSHGQSQGQKYNTSHQRQQRKASQQIQMYAQCKTCARFSRRQIVSSQLFEYSKARFFEQFFYNDKLKIKEGVFECGHGRHPLRDYILEFQVDSCKVRFCYTQVDTYSIQIVSPKKYSSRESLRLLVQERKEKLQEILEKAIDNFKHDQIEVLQEQIRETIAQCDLANEAKYRGTNMHVFVEHFNIIMQTLESMKTNFRTFQDEAAQELDRFKDELLHLMFLKRKILMTFLGYQRTIDESLSQLALLIVVTKRRAMVIDFHLSRQEMSPSSPPCHHERVPSGGSTAEQRNGANQVKNGGIASSGKFSMVEGEEHSMGVISGSMVQYGVGMPSSMAHSTASALGAGDDEMSELSTTEVVKAGDHKAKQLKKKKKLTAKADIVQEEEEKESDNSSRSGSAQGAEAPLGMTTKAKPNKDESGDGMATVEPKEYFTDSEGQSETSVRRMSTSFNQMDLSRRSRQASLTQQRVKRHGLASKRSFVSEANGLNGLTKQLSESVDDAANTSIMSRRSAAGTNSFIAGRIQQRSGGFLNGRNKATGTASASQVSSLKNKEPLGAARRKLHDSNLHEGVSNLISEEDPSAADKEFKTRCFIEDLCTCEIFEQPLNTGAKNDQATNESVLRHQHFASSQASSLVNPRKGQSMRVQPGEFKSLLTKTNTMDPSDSQNIDMASILDKDSNQEQVSKKSRRNEATNPLAQSERQDAQIGPTRQTQTVANQIQIQLNPTAAQSSRTIGLRQIRKPVTFCPMSNHVSLNKHCSNADHIVTCYYKMNDEVAEMRNYLEKAVYLSQDAAAKDQGFPVPNQKSKVIVLNDLSPQESLDAEAQSQEFRDFKFGKDTTVGCQVREASQIEGFDTILVERNPKTTGVFDESSGLLNDHRNRQGGDLRVEYDFIQIPKHEKTRQEDNSHSPNREASSPIDYQTPQTRGNNRDSLPAIRAPVDPPMSNKWLNIKWITTIAKFFPTLPFGVDNIYMNVNPQDFGSIIAFALTSNIYLEGLARLNYMDLEDILKKQNKNKTQQNGELLDKDDVLNYKGITSNQIEAEMLAQNKRSFAIKFSTHSKDVSITVHDGREMQTLNHAERHYKTGYTEKRLPTQKSKLVSDLQSVGGQTQQSEYKSVKGSVAGRTSKNTAGKGSSKPEIKSKKVFNDFQLKVLPKYPKEYLRNLNITDAVNDLEEVQSDLCRTYFSQDQIKAIKHFVNYRTPMLGQGVPPAHSMKEDAYNQNSMMLDPATNGMVSMAQYTQQEAGGHVAGDAHNLSNFVQQDQSYHFMNESTCQNAMMHESVDYVSMADMRRPSEVTDASMAFKGAAATFERTTFGAQAAAVNKRNLKKYVKAQEKLLQKKDENQMHLEEGQIFGVKSPAQSISSEQKDATKFISEELKIPRIDFEVKIYYPKRFSALRRFYVGTHLDYIMSICKTKSWSSSGGKAAMGFFTTHDKKFVFKCVKKEEFEMFCTFAPTFFDYMTKSFFHKVPCCLAKIVGAYDVKVQCDSNPELESRTYLLVSENLNLGLKPEDEQNIIRFDLKGSENNRLVTPPMGPDGPERIVLLDNNFLYKMRSRPIVLPFQEARTLHICINNDISCLKRANIVDYSLLAIVDTRKKKIRFAILDYCQFFNSKKQVEYRFKHAVNLGSLPTIVPPEQYKPRFLDFMYRHFMGVHSQLVRKKGRKTSREQAKRSIVVQAEDIDNILQQTKQVMSIEQVMREVNGATDGAAAGQSGPQTIGQATNAQTIRKINSSTQLIQYSMIDTTGAGGAQKQIAAAKARHGMSPMMH